MTTETKKVEEKTVVTYKVLIAAANKEGYTQVFNTYGKGSVAKTSPKRVKCSACSAQIKQLPIDQQRAPWVNKFPALVFHRTHAVSGQYDLIYACTCGWRKRANASTVSK